MIKIKDSIWEQYRKNERSDRRFYMAIMIIALVVVLILFLNTFVFFNVQVIGESMYPTLDTEDVLVVNRYKEVNRGNIIIIADEKPESDDWLIKRVIAIGGDYVEIKSDGYVYVNDVKIEENYLAEDVRTEPMMLKRKLNDNEIFYLGDNRGNSSDSRIYGTCTFGQVVGVVENWSVNMKKVIKWMYGAGREVPH